MQGAAVRLPGAGRFVFDWREAGSTLIVSTPMSSFRTASIRLGSPSGVSWATYMLGFLLLSEALLLGFAIPYSNLAGIGNPVRFVALLLGAGLAYLVALPVYDRVPSRYRPAFFWVASIVFRLVALPMAPGDDIWRYFWEARIWREGFNPYLVSPGSPLLVPLQDINWAQINHPGYAAIYPPGAQLIMAGMASISATPLFFKCVFVVADLLILYFLLRINTGSKRYRTTAWYAWSPAVVYAFAGAGHFDCLMLLPLVGAIWGLYRSDPLDRQPPEWMWSIISAVLLGLSISIKIIPIFLLPVWGFMLRRRCIVLLLSLIIPFSLTFLFGGPETVLYSLRNFTEVTRFNDLFWWLFEGVRGQQEGNNRLYATVLGIAVIVCSLVFRRYWRRGSLWVLGATLILSPALHPWYVTWILPIACWRQAYPWFILALSSLNALLVWEAGPFWQPWMMTWQLRLLVILPPIIAAVYWYGVYPRFLKETQAAADESGN